MTLTRKTQIIIQRQVSLTNISLIELLSKNTEDWVAFFFFFPKRGSFGFRKKNIRVGEDQVVKAIRGVIDQFI